MVEFAIIVPLFLLLMFALIDFSRLLFTYISLSNGTREMARVAAVTTGWSNAAVISAFKNATIIADAHYSGADQVTVQWGDYDCAKKQDAGQTCTAPHTLSTLTPACPLSTMSCTLTQPPQGGFVEVTATYHFNFNPLFQTRLEGLIDVSFMNPTATLTTTSRAYVE
jgi:Flp pilus assembly protein TadG